MGRAQRPRPLQLATKLRLVRERLGLTKREMFHRLQSAGVPMIHEGYIALFEMGTREPDLLTLLSYSRIAGVSVEMLIDDDLKLPSVLPEVKGVTSIRKARQSNR